MVPEVRDDSTRAGCGSANVVFVEKALGLKPNGDADRKQLSGREGGERGWLPCPPFSIAGRDADSADMEDSRPRLCEGEEEDASSGLAIRRPPRD